SGAASQTRLAMRTPHSPMNFSPRRVPSWRNSNRKESTVVVPVPVGSVADGFSIALKAWKDDGRGKKLGQTDVRRPHKLSLL
ncbi:hypothetical protein PIB30_080682, partial [Stylosanthes scabra]|nr:hypothetical protein [Stylosanthes scabra]